MGRSTTSITLLDRAKAGADSAWLELQSLYTPLIYYWCRKCGLPQGDVEEVWTNVFGLVAEKLSGFNHNGRTGAFRTWLRTITQHAVADHRRDRRGLVGQHELVEAAEAPVELDTSPTIEKSILYRRAWALIQGEFSARDNEIFRRIVENGEEPKDVAEDMSLSRPVVYSVVFRIKKRLQKRFGDMLDDDD